MTYKKDGGNQGKTSKNDVKLHKAAHQSAELFPRGQLDNIYELSKLRKEHDSVAIIIIIIILMLINYDGDGFATQLRTHQVQRIIRWTFLGDIFIQNVHVFHRLSL